MAGGDYFGFGFWADNYWNDNYWPDYVPITVGSFFVNGESKPAKSVLGGSIKADNSVSGRIVYENIVMGGSKKI